MAPRVDKIPKLPSIKRLPNYLHILKELRGRGKKVVSTTLLAEKINLESIVVRKDLAITGILGQPGVGYKIDELITAIEDFLGWNNVSDAFVIGTGCLGSALLGYEGFENHGLNVIAGFDIDTTKIGIEIHGKPVYDINQLKDMTSRLKVHLGILCVPAVQAQRACDMLVNAGIRGIWNFTPVNLEVPPNVVTQREDLASGLAVLSVKLSKQLSG